MWAACLGRMGFGQEREQTDPGELTSSFSHAAASCREQLGLSADEAHPAGQEVHWKKDQWASVSLRATLHFLLSLQKHTHWHTFYFLDKNHPHTTVSSSIILFWKLCSLTRKHRHIFSKENELHDTKWSDLKRQSCEVDAVWLTRDNAAQNPWN